MDEIKYNGKTYHRYTNKWADDRGFAVHTLLQNKLNKLFADTLDVSNMSVAELIAEGDKYKKSASYLLAVKYYETAIPRCDRHTLSYILPRISSCYRACHCSPKAISLFSYAKKKYGADIITPVLLTTAAAAYCDMGEYEKATKCCKRAYAQNHEKNDESLKNVMNRIEREVGTKW